MKPRIVIHIFHRDLRIVDNAALNIAHKKATEAKADLVTLFIFTPEQVTSNTFKSENSIEFMLNSLEDLNDDLRMIYFRDLDLNLYFSSLILPDEQHHDLNINSDQQEKLKF
jgi:deoxyribodipyrimidine photolyase